jgi:hypothetical protein
MTDHELEKRIYSIIDRACAAYADGLVRGPVKTRPYRREAAIVTGVSEVWKIVRSNDGASQ